MATALQNIQKALGFIGVSGTDNIFNTWYWGFHCYDPDTYPWCAVFQSYIAELVGGLGYVKNAAASGIFNQLPRVADQDVQPGDYVCFNWDGRNDTSWMDHIAMVIEFDYNSGYLKVIEGNGGYGGGIVQEHEYNNNSTYFTAFCRPQYSSCSDETPASNTTPDIPMPRFRVYTKEDGWLDWMDGLRDSGGSADDFGGERGHAIRNAQVENLGPNGWFRLNTKHGELGKNEENAAGDEVIGLTVYYDTPNPSATGYYKAAYQVSPIGKNYLKLEYDDEDGGAGNDRDAIDRIRLYLEKA